MSDLIAKLRAQLDDDERAALYATQDNGTGIWDEVVSGTLRLNGVEGLDGLIPIGDQRLTRHMERHDPARVLRQVAAMRKILDLHEPFVADENEPDPICQTCIEGSHLYDVNAYPCPTVLAVAEAYGLDTPNSRVDN